MRRQMRVNIQLVDFRGSFYFIFSSMIFVIGKQVFFPTWKQAFPSFNYP